jgi:hypothetical protein
VVHDSAYSKSKRRASYVSDPARRAAIAPRSKARDDSDNDRPSSDVPFPAMHAWLQQPLPAKVIRP